MAERALYIDSNQGLTIYFDNGIKLHPTGLETTTLPSEQALALLEEQDRIELSGKLPRLECTEIWTDGVCKIKDCCNTWCICRFNPLADKDRQVSKLALEIHSLEQLGPRLNRRPGHHRKPPGQ